MQQLSPGPSHRVIRQAHDSEHRDERPRDDRAGGGDPARAEHPVCAHALHLDVSDTLRQGASGGFPDAVLGLSDHSIGNYACFGAVALGARILEKHFTSDKSWPGPDVPISIDPVELGELIRGARAVSAALGGHKRILSEEQPTIDFAYACVVTIRDVAAGEALSRHNVWVKRPGTGSIKAASFEQVLGRVAVHAISKDTQLSFEDLA